MKKLYLAMLVVLCTSYTHLHSMDVLETTAGTSYYEWLKARKRDLGFHKDLLKTLPDNPSTCLRAIASIEKKFTVGSLELMLPHIHKALDQGGQFDLTGIDKSHIYRLASLAASLNDLKTVKALLEAGSRISPEYNRTILSGEARDDRILGNISLLSETFDILAHRKDTDMFHLLISFGADINNDRGICEKTLFHKAIDIGKADLVEFLLAAGARLDVKNEFGDTPIDDFEEKVREHHRWRDQEQDTRIAALLEEYQIERILHPVPSLVDQCVAVATRHGLDIKSTGFDIEASKAGEWAGRFMLVPAARTEEATAAGLEVE